ncbi:hypothetical protein AAT16_10790 [Salinicoccus halodurans]|uniref:Uncharacterized protein n=1 Tax=Salinicoccus halodurans TaxID=407035 RepID=A0ABM5TA18_9STAP|nr:hypothetical protein AAT16_10790 [Salinicoccus halodurans]
MSNKRDKNSIVFFRYICINDIKGKILLEDKHIVNQKIYSIISYMPFNKRLFIRKSAYRKG